MEYEDLVKQLVHDLCLRYSNKTLPFAVLKECLENKFGYELNKSQIEKAKLILANQNPPEIQTCTALPDGWISR